MTIPKMPQNSFSSILVSDEDIVNAIRVMNKNSAPGIDCVPAQFVKQISCYLVKPLRMIFHESFQSGMVPDCWRTGITVPIYKNNGKPEDPASYRPVCLTSVIGKLSERTLLSYLTPYLEQNNLISEYQHAFVTGKSTATNLLECVND